MVQEPCLLKIQKPIDLDSVEGLDILKTLGFEVVKKDFIISAKRIDPVPKRVFFAFSGNTVIFSDKMENIAKKVKGITIDKTSVDEFMQMGFVVFPYTFYEKVYEIPGLSRVIMTDNSLEIRIPIPKIAKDGDYSRLKRIVERIIEDSMNRKKKMLLLLSGGLDSSLLATFLSKEKDSCVTISFPGSTLDEYTWAKKVTSKLEIHHERRIVTPESLKEAFTEVLEFYKEPVGDMSTLYLMSSKDLIQNAVIVSGEGADSILCGSYPFLAEHIITRYLRLNIFRKITGKILGSLKGKREGGFKSILRRLGIFGKICLLEPTDRMIAYFTGNPNSEVCSKMVRFKNLISKLESITNDRMKQLILLIIYFVFPKLEMFKYRIMEEKYNANVVFPFLNQELVDFVLSVNTHKFMSITKGKKVLREIYKDRNGEKSILRRPKEGFNGPKNLTSKFVTDLAKDMSYCNLVNNIATSIEESDITRTYRVLALKKFLHHLRQESYIDVIIHEQKEKGLY